MDCMDWYNGLHGLLSWIAWTDIMDYMDCYNGLHGLLSWISWTAITDCMDCDNGLHGPLSWIAWTSIMVFIGRDGSFDRGASLYRHRLHLFWRLWVRLYLRFNSLPIMSSLYCARWNKGKRLLSVLKLWPIVETLVMSENDGTTVRQTVAHTVQLWTHDLGTPCGSRFSRRKAH